MAFTAAAGHGNLPNGVFSPTIFSKKALMEFRKSSVVEDITNTDYYGEIKDYGDSVKIIKEPKITVRPYGRGAQVQAEDLIDEDFTMTIDQSNYFAFKVDDIEQKQSHVNFETLASNRAAYELKDAYDKAILAYMAANATGTLVLGTASTPKKIGLSGSYDFTPLGLMNRINRLLTVNNVPTDQRYFVADPFFWEITGDENNKLMDASFSGDSQTPIRNGKISNQKIRNFTSYESNNLPTLGLGPDATGSNNYGVIIAGHMSAVATAMNLSKTEKMRDTNSFGDIVRGMHLYGRSVIRPEALAVVLYQKV